MTAPPLVPCTDGPFLLKPRAKEGGSGRKVRWGQRLLVFISFSVPSVLTRTGVTVSEWSGRVHLRAE